MRTFKDTEGVEWVLQLDVALLTRVKNDTGKLLTSLGDNSSALLIELHENFPLSVDILWCLCRDQAKTKGIVDDANSQATEKFAKRLFGDPLGDAIEALVGAIIDFFPNRGQREALAALMEKTKKTQEIVVENMAKKISEIDPNTLAKTYFGSVLSLAESSESVPSLKD